MDPDEHPAQAPIDFELLAGHLRALAHPARLELLWRLRVPQRTGDVTLRPRRHDADLAADRVMARQSIQSHLDTLEQVGLVLRTPHPEGGAAQWVTSHQHVFAIVEEMRSLTAIRPAVAVDVDATLSQQPSARAAWPPGPKLALVTGPWQGHVFPLTGEGPWSIGRSRSCAVSLAYDPFASAEHARVELVDGAFTLAPAAGTRNPASLNFEPLHEGATPLAPGDVVGIGRSFLVFKPE